MRYSLPATAATVALAIGSVPAIAQQTPHQSSVRRRSHISLHLSRHGVLSGRTLIMRGRVHPAGRHRVRLVFRGPERGSIGIVTSSNGFFSRRWRPGHIGIYGLRAFEIHDRATRGSASLSRRLTAYHLARASYFGPGLYGGALACGGTLLPGTLGVASKTLPCGTMVRLLYRGNSITVAVIDRGPYVAGREFDLTAATRARLGFPGVGTLLSSR
jgi:rare lipoprotein A